MEENIDQTARDRVADVKAQISAHEQVCEQVRRRMEETMRRIEQGVAEIKINNANAVAEIKATMTEHADEDRGAFKAVFARFWWLAGGGYGVLIPLVGFLIGKLLHWL